MEKYTKVIMSGNGCMAICCVIYLIWWSVVFRPEFRAPGPLAVILFLLTAGTGITGLILLISGIRNMPSVQPNLSNQVIMIAGICLYIILFFVSFIFMHRQVTTELLLIIGWGMLVLCEVNVMYGAGNFSLQTVIISCILIGIVALISMICYLTYYNLKPMVAYVDGMVPLLLIGAVMLGLSVMIWHGKRG